MSCDSNTAKSDDACAHNVHIVYMYTGLLQYNITLCTYSYIHTYMILFLALYIVSKIASYSIIYYLYIQ